MSQDNGHDEVAAAARFAERAVGERGESGRGVRAGSGSPPDPELVERPKRRRFTAEYKLAIVREADACSGPGEIGALLRREGLYSSHLVDWRRARDAGARGALERPRGRKPPNRLEVENADLRRRAERAEVELAKARRVIELQGNVSALLEQMLETRGAPPSTTER